jgi:hypothetical protein
MSDSTERCESQFRWPQPGELWSLWDMYNFVLADFHAAIISTAKAHQHTTLLERSGNIYVEEARRESFIRDFRNIHDLCERHDFTRAQHVCSWLLSRLQSPPMTMAMLRDNTRSLNEALHDDALQTKAYIYRGEQAILLDAINRDWRVVFSVLPECASEIRAAIDLWALDHGTASVFHSMRACELGLRFIARKFDVTFENKHLEWAMWSSLINKLQSKLDDLKNTPNGPQKDSDKMFLGTVITHWTAIQEKRDSVMHVRKEFDVHEARSVLMHVQELLGAIAARYPPAEIISTRV